MSKAFHCNNWTSQEFKMKLIDLFKERLTGMSYGGIRSFDSKVLSKKKKSEDKNIFTYLCVWGFLCTYLCLLICESISVSKAFSGADR